MRYILITLVAIICAGCLPQTQQDLVSKATEAMSQGNVEKAKELLTEAAKNDYKPAVELFVAWYDNDLLEWELKGYNHWLEKSAELGNVKSMSKLAEANRRIGNESEQIKWLTKASEAGSVKDTLYLSDYHVKRLADSMNGDEFKHWANKLFDATYQLKDDLPPPAIALSGIKLIYSEDSQLMRQGYQLLGYLLFNNDLTFKINKERELQITKSGKQYAIPTFKSLLLSGRDGDIKAAIYYVLSLIKAKNQLLQNTTVDYVEVGRVMTTYSMYIDFIHSKITPKRDKNYNKAFRNFREYIIKNCIDWQTQCAAVDQYAHLYK